MNTARIIRIPAGRIQVGDVRRSPRYGTVRVEDVVRKREGAVVLHYDSGHCEAFAGDTRVAVQVEVLD